MDWIHCNNCYVQPGDVEKKKFFITNCGHIYCDECLELNRSGECRICQVKYTTVPLSSNMNAEVEVYFHDPLVSMKKQMKVLEFQQSHRIRIAAYNLKRIRSYELIKKENNALREKLKACKKENEMLQQELRRAKNDFHEFRKKYQQPTPTSDCSMSSRIRPMQSFSQLVRESSQRSSPSVLSKANVESEGSFELNLKKTPNSNFFFMSESKSSRKSGINFTTPDPSRFPGPYRSYKTSTPETTTPPTPDTFFRGCNQGSDLQRRVKLPSGPSPSTRIGLHSLSLSRLASTPKKSTPKYTKYFK